MTNRYQYTVAVENKYFEDLLEVEASSKSEAIAKAKAMPKHPDLTGKLRYRVVA